MGMEEFCEEAEGTPGVMTAMPEWAGDMGSHDAAVMVGSDAHGSRFIIIGAACHCDRGTANTVVANMLAELMGNPEARVEVIAIARKYDLLRPPDEGGVEA